MTEILLKRMVNRKSSIHLSETMGPRAYVFIETMLLLEIGPQLKLPINLTKGSMPLQCYTIVPEMLAI